MSELTAKENIKTADTVKRITATAVMAALTTLMTAYIFHIPVGVNGAIGSTYNFMLKKFKRIWNAYHDDLSGSSISATTLRMCGRSDRRWPGRSSDSTCMGACNHNYQNADLSSIFF